MGIVNVKRYSQNLFFAGILLAATGLVSPPVALAGGLVFAFFFLHPLPIQARHLSHFLLQASVVLLGFSMNLGAVLAAGRSGLLYSAIGITATLSIGLALGKFLRVERVGSTLIASGTAICGGSAIAALSPVLEAGEEPMAVALGSVFVLNSVALFLFPALGHWLGLTQAQFGLWSALAIHDTRSVVGASAKFGTEALAIAVPVKLVRALWIIPVCLGFAAWLRSKTAGEAGIGTGGGRRTRVPLPWFLLGFLLAAATATFLPGWVANSGWFAHGAEWLHSGFATLSMLGRSGLAVTLFLIGASLNPAALKQVGMRPLVQAVVLWLIAGSASLWAIEGGWIHL